MIAKYRESETHVTWQQMTESFTRRYASLTKQAEISNRLEAITIEDVSEDDKDDYTVLDKLTKRINELELIDRIKDHDDEAKVRFLTREV